MRVAIIGTGYVGLTTGAALAFLGHEVLGVDRDPNKLAMMRAGKSPIHERGLEDLMRSCRSLSFTDDTASAVTQADVIIIAVGTPSTPSGAADVSFVEEAARAVASGLQDGREYTIVVKSTVPVGTNRRVANVIRKGLEQRGVHPTVRFASNPEFLREGKALVETLYPDRIVVGSDSQDALDTMRKLYARILDQSFTPPAVLPRPVDYRLPTFLNTDATSAEMIKYASNAFLALKISYINEIAGLCERVGADVRHVARGMGLDQRINPLFLAAGLGWGGSCFPKDTLAILSLASEYGYKMPIVAASREVNQNQRTAVVEKLQAALKVLRGQVIGILGLAFKPGTDDVRDAPALEIIDTLSERGAHLRLHDPIALANARELLAGKELDFFEDPYALAEGADALVVATEWDDYRDLDLQRLASIMKTPVLIDARNLFEREEAERAGLRYAGVGR
ncbi:MAG: UDP-glucose/GDP-mannose dehydrogenase family protein [Myxococcota bacterium]|jgi:UDPglucose 6-dehydrogenase|nr:UDP-glucose/GDP-mannose dehydrogenase family protein [Myxococcota bacterium]